MQTVHIILHAALPNVKPQQAVPTFGTRGLQPFHDFASGPDWWTEQDYKVGDILRRQHKFG